MLYVIYYNIYSTPPLEQCVEKMRQSLARHVTTKCPLLRREQKKLFFGHKPATQAPSKNQPKDAISEKKSEKREQKVQHQTKRVKATSRLPNSTKMQPQPHHLIHTRRAQTPRSPPAQNALLRRNEAVLRIRRALPPALPLPVLPLPLPSPTIPPLLPPSIPPLHPSLSVHTPHRPHPLPQPDLMLPSPAPRFLNADGHMFAKLHAARAVETDDAARCVRDSDAGAGGRAGHGEIVGVGG